MTEQVWRHRFVQALFQLIKKETGLGDNSSYDLAFDEVDRYWREMVPYDTPELAAAAAFSELKS